MTPEERRKLNEVHQFMKQMQAAPTVPLSVEKAIKLRVNEDEIILDTTGKSLTSEQHGAAAAGLKDPEVWGEVTIEGTRHFIPLYT